MPNYQTGKIYRIYAILSDGTTISYYGATTKNLRVRLAGHVQSAKKGGGTTSKHIIAAGNYNIMLMENFPCNSREELNAREQYYILNNECVNKVVPLRTKKQYYVQNADNIKEQKKQYYVQNADNIKEQKKQYYVQNADNIKDKYKQYYVQNADAIKEQHKQYRVQNADTIKEQHKQYRVQNADNIKEHKKQYYVQNVDRIKEYYKQYRLRKKATNLSPDNAVDISDAETKKL
jgi:hypothetical protein